MPEKINTGASLPKVNLFVVGVQKAGTTALAHFLQQHNDVCLVNGKEAHVFDHPAFRDGDEESAFAAQLFSKKAEHYQGERYLCDATPITLFHPLFIERCCRYNPHAKFIVLLRDPVDRAVSHYIMSKNRGLETYSMLRAFLSEPFRMRGWRKKLPTEPFESKFRDFSYLARGHYSDQLAHLRKYVPESNILILQQAALLQEHENTIRRVTRFLDLPLFDPKAESVFSAEKQKKTLNMKLAIVVARTYFTFIKIKSRIKRNPV